MNGVFSEQILVDKLSKLNNTQQCIETLSHWCIFHQQKAVQVVQTWDKQFHSSQKEQKIPFLYLANDILQNSRRKGNEFVVEFWMVLPAALKDVAENGEDRGKNVVSRLVGIWDERRVFGSRTQSLKDLMLGNEPLPALEFNKKRSRSVRIVRRDSRSIKTKLSIGGMTEKIVSAFHTVLSEHHNEDAELNRCKAVVHHVGKMEKGVEIACSQVGDPRRVTLAAELQEEENIMKQCFDNLKSVETNRATLVSLLREALHEQESALENVRTQLQVAQVQMEEASNMHKRLNNEPVVPSTSAAMSREDSTPLAAETPKKSAATIAAEVADQLAASTHSQQIITSVLSTFAAEAAKNAGLATTPKPSTLTGNPSENRLKLEKPMSVPETTPIAAQGVTAAYQRQTLLVHQPSIQTQASSMQQPQYGLYPTPAQQYMQPTGGMMIGVPYTYSSLPPPPAPVYMMNIARPAPLTPQQTMAMIQPPPPPQMPPMSLQQPPPLNPQPSLLHLQQPAPPSYRPLQPTSMTFYHQ